MRIRRNLRILCALMAAEIAKKEGRPPPRYYARLLDDTGKSPAELIAEVEANHWTAVRQGEEMLWRQAGERPQWNAGERMAA
jgi:hypothetical protein